MADPTMPFSPCDPDAGACTDVSVGILQWVFGPVIERLTQGADPGAVDVSSSVLASMLSTFNSGIFVFASLVMSYMVLVGVVNTANEGEALGKNWSSVWTPVRAISGMSMLLPTASGYSFIQLIVMMFALWGVGFANSMFKKGTESGFVNGALTNVSSQIGMGSGTRPNPNYPLYDLREFAQDYLSIAWCRRTVNAIYSVPLGSASAGDPPSDPERSPQVSASSAPDSYSVEAPGKKSSLYLVRDRNQLTNLGGGTPVCGSIKTYSYSPPPTLSVTPAIGSIFDPTAIQSNSDAISALRIAVLSAKAEAINGMMNEIENWVREWPKDVTKPEWNKVDSNRLNQIVNNAQNRLSEALARQIKGDTTLQMIMKKYVNDVTKDGWAMAGGFYQRLSGVRDEMRKIYAENAAQASPPNLNSLPRGPQAALAQWSHQTVYAAVVAKALDGANFSPSAVPRGSDFQAVFVPASFEDLSIDTLGNRGDSVMSNFVGWGMERISSTLIGTDGDVDAIARIKTTGDILTFLESQTVLINNTVYTAASAAKATVGVAGSVSILGTSVDLTGVANTFMDWLSKVFLEPMAEMSTWLGRLAFYFGVFLPSLPYTIFMIAVVGWVLAVLQSIVAAPLWAIMHMTPDRTFIGSQSQGYLLIASLFARPALIIFGLYAAMMVANPIVQYIAKAFWAMRSANVTSSESLGWYIEFLNWKNWLVVYGFVLLPVTYMIFGLSQALPDTALSWIGAGIRPMGETQATGEMRGGMEKAGPMPSEPRSRLSVEQRRIGRKDSPGAANQPVNAGAQGTVPGNPSLNAGGGQGVVGNNSTGNYI